MTSNEHDVYERVGVTPLINAAGTFTDLGGSIMAPEVTAAWQAAARCFVDFRELQDRVGERIAKLLSVESALVTGGAASGIMLGTAAAITRRNANFVSQPVVADDGEPFEVLRQRSHRDLYDRQVQMCGARIVEVETEDDFASFVSKRTVLAIAYNLYDNESPIRHDAWLRLARKYDIPTLLDAAADTPPVSNLNHFTQVGYDLVAFSGGKAICGPQRSGLLLGSAELIDLAKRNAVPNEGTIGRVAKVSKEDVIALLAALELYLQEGEHAGDAIAERCQRQLDVIHNELEQVDGLQFQWVTPAGANHFPHLIVKWDEASIQLTRQQVAEQLRQGRPAIATGRVYGTGDEGLLLSAINLQAGEADTVGKRLRWILENAHRDGSRRE